MPSSASGFAAVLIALCLTLTGRVGHAVDRLIGFFARRLGIEKREDER